MLDFFQSLPPQMGGLYWSVGLLGAMLGFILVVKLLFSAADQRRKTVQRKAAENRLVAIETRLEEIAERLERLERIAASGRGAGPVSSKSDQPTQ